MKKLFTCTVITLLSVASAAAQEEFKFEVTTTEANQVFAIPVSGGGSSGKNYYWNINWGDGNTSTSVSGIGSTLSAGVSHTYATAKTYQITITPAGNNNRWLAAFGFVNGTNGANVQTNKDLVTKVLSPITPLMTRTQAEIDTNTTTPPESEWENTFYGCTNLTMGPAFTFSTAWNSITTVGGGFASYMFSNCSGAAFTMNTVFNLPQNLTTVGTYFASRMFNSCSGAAFKMNTVFNLPQNSTTAGDFFASNMFQNCSGGSFTMNAVFNLPQNITTMYYDFARGMFNGCFGAAFTMNSVFNLPQNFTTVGDYFAANMFQNCSGAAFTMNTVFNLPQNLTTVGIWFASDMFHNCSGAAFKMSTIFNLPQNITTVGKTFAYNMFHNCSGAAFTMNTVFNLPQNLTTVGDYFAASMFDSCSGAAFTMNSVFNLPQNLTTVGNYFCYIFYGCSGAAFTMNSVFNLPQNITTVGSDFAASMFYGCSGNAFQVNNVFTFPRLAQTEINKSNVFNRTFSNLGTSTTQSRTAASIINGDPTPSSNKGTFASSGCFIDIAYIPVNWGGGGLDTTFIVTYNYNGATGGNTTPDKLVPYNKAYGTLPTPTKDSYTVTYNYNGSAQTDDSDTYNPTFGGWYLEATFTKAITATTIVTTFSDHTIYAKWNGALTLPTPDANAGYTFAGWYSEASCVNFVGNAGDSYAPTANTTLYAKWRNTFTIEATAGSNGTINPSGTVTVSHGSNSPYFYFAANAGYTIDKVRIDNVENATAKTDGFYMFTNVTEDHQIYVSFTSSVGIVGTQLIASFPRIYPNPTNGQLTIASPNPSKGGEQATIEIYDVVGQVVFTSQLSKSSPETTIDISHLANGLYFLKIDGKMVKIIKE